MKVLLVNKFHFLKGGSEKYYFTLADAFNKCGHEVIFFAMRDEKNIPCKESEFFVDKVGTDGGIKNKIKMILRMRYSRSAYKKMTALLKKEKPDLVILNLVHKQITCSVIDAIKDYDKDLPIFWTMHDLIAVCPSYTMLNGKGEVCDKCLNGDFSFCFKNRCIRGSALLSYLSVKEAKFIKKRKFYDKVDLFICPSQFYADTLKSANFTRSPIKYIVNPLPDDTDYEIKNYNGDYILYLGRLVKEKGVIDLLSAVKGENVKLKIAGEGPEEKDLKDYANANGLNNVEFLGFKSGKELSEIIDNAKAIVIPSKWNENCPYSALESMAKGKPLIVSSLGGLPELVDDGETGYIYKTQEELKEKIKKVFSLNDKEYKDTCRKVLTKAKDKFSATGYVERLIKEYKQIKENR